MTKSIKDALGGSPFSDDYNPILSEAARAIEYAITTNQIVKGTWADLKAIDGGNDGQGGEVLSEDSGTHQQASADGYDDGAVDNAGRYSWNSDWGRWERIGDNDVSLLASIIDLEVLTQSLGALATKSTIAGSDIDEKAVGNAKLADMSPGTMKWRDPSEVEDGKPTNATLAVVRAAMGVAEGADNTQVVMKDAETKGALVWDDRLALLDSEGNFGLKKTNLSTLKTWLAAAFGTVFQARTTALDGTQQSFTTALKEKVDAIAPGATANATDANLKDRGYHTGTQGIDTVTGLQGALDGKATAAQGSKADTALQSGADVSALAETESAKIMTATERTKLSGIAPGATANATDANLKDRGYHTGTQGIDTVTGLQGALDGKATAAQGSKADTALQSGADVSALAETESAKIMTATERTKLSGIAPGATANASDAYLKARGSHTGTQGIDTVTGLQAALDGKATTAQGGKADTALQPVDTATPATLAAWSEASTGALADRDPLTVGTIVNNTAFGPALRLASADIPASPGYLDQSPRQIFHLSGDEQITFKMRLQRTLDSADPIDSTVAIYVRDLASDLTHLTASIAYTGTPTVADSAVYVDFTVGRQAGADIVISGSAAAFSVFYRVFSDAGELDLGAAVWSRDGFASADREALTDLKDDAVLKTGDQTIAGEKTFTSPPVSSGDATTNTQLIRKGQLSAVATSGDTDDLTEGSTQLLLTTAERGKLSNVTVTSAVDLDAIDARVTELDASVILKGAFNPVSGAFPGAGLAQAGESWVVNNIPGNVGAVIDGVEFNPGDQVIALVDDAPTDTYEDNWLKIDSTSQVSSVVGEFGAVTVTQIIAAIKAEADTNFPTDAEMVNLATGHLQATTQHQSRDAGQAIWVTSDAVLYPRMRIERDGAAAVNTSGAPAGGFVSVALETAGTATRFYWVDLSTGDIETAETMPTLSTSIVILGSSRAGSYCDKTGLPVIIRDDAAQRNNIIPIGVSGLIGGAMPNAEKNSPDIQNVSSTKWTEYSPHGTGGLLRSTTAGAKISLTHLPIGHEVLIQDAVNSADAADRVEIFVGHDRNNFNGGGGGSIKVDSRFGVVSIRNNQGVLSATAEGSIDYTQSAMTTFVAETSILLAGQSFMSRFAADGGVGGFTAGLRSEDDWLESPVDESIRFIQGATGGSTIFKSEAADGQEYWIDDDTSDDPLDWIDGSCMDTLRAALDEAVTTDGQPKPNICFFQLGTSSMAAVDNGDTDLAKTRAGYKWIWSEIRDETRTGDNVRIIASVPGGVVADTPRGASGIRQALLDEIEDNTWAYQGPETYDLFRETAESEVHLTKSSFWAWGRRWSRHYANRDHAQTNNLGPTANVVLHSDTTRAVVNVVSADGLDIDAALGNHNAKTMVADYPHSVGFIAAGTDAADTLVGYSVFCQKADEAEYTFQTGGDLTGAKVIFPAGLVADVATGNFIRDSDGLPLRSFVSGAIT